MKTACIYCGNNPVPHRIYWYNESLNIFLRPFRQFILYNRLTFALADFGLGAAIIRWCVRAGEFFKIISYNQEITKCKVERAKVLWEEAEKRGLTMRELLLFGRPFDCYIAEKTHPLSLIPDLSQIQKQAQIIFSGLPRPQGKINRWLDLMDDKWLFKQRMMQAGLPVPAGASCSGLHQAIKIFEDIQSKKTVGNWEIGKFGNLDPGGESDGRRVGSNNPDKIDSTVIRPSTPVIVKPRAGSRGRHSTTNVRSVEELKTAFSVAKQLCFWVMVEEHLPGPVYRATVINFQLAGVLRGDAPFVVGDGLLTVEELVKQKNLQPHPGVKDIQTGNSEINFLKRQKLSLDSIVQVGQTVYLSEKIGVNYGGSSSEDYELCHPDNRELFVRAAKSLGDPVVGFDFIIPDISKSWKEQKCGFIEANSLPFINLHHNPLFGRPRNVAAKVWEMVGM
jgi:hypothetical protein